MGTLSRDEAERAYLRQVEVKPSHHRAAYGAARMALRGGRDREAKDLFKGLLGVDDTVAARSRLELAMIAREERSFGEAQEHFEAYIRTLPDEEAARVFDKAFGRILRTDTIRAFAEVATADPETLYSLDPKDYQAARRLVLEAISR